MGRTSSKLDKKLIKAGIKLAEEKGLNALGVREVCAAAKVNLGMFHYYFGSKKGFREAILKNIYAELMTELKVNFAKNTLPRKNIEKILLIINDFSKKHRRIISALLGDIVRGDVKIMKFVLANMTEHIQMLFAELKNIKNLPIRAKKQNTFNLLISLAMPVVFPNIVCGILERMHNKEAEILMNKMDTEIQNEQSVKMRIDMLIEALLGQEARE